ncbi:hypothetical protein IWW50_005830, partial [Coemansia erecta]
QQAEGCSELATRDESLLQALKSTVLRPLLQPSPWAGKTLSRASSRSSSGGNRPKQVSLASVPRRQYGAAALGIGRLQKCFASQMRYGCAGGCQVRFCRGNARFEEQLRAMAPASVDQVAVELARRAVERPRSADVQPHSEDELGGVTSEGEDSASFVQALARAMQRAVAAPPVEGARRISGQHMATAVKAVMGRVGNNNSDDDGLALGVSRLDAQTAPLVAAIGGRLLGNTVEVAFSSRRALARSFRAAGVAPGVDVAAAVDFFERAYAQGMERRVMDALRRSVAANFDTGAAGFDTGVAGFGTGAAGFEADAHVLALGVLAVGVARTDAGTLRRQLTRLLVEQMYESSSNSTSEGGWFGRFTQDSAARRAWVAWWAAAPAGVVRAWAGGLRSDAAAAAGRLLGGLTSDSVVARRVAADPVRWTGALELLRVLSEAAAASVGAAAFACPELLELFDLRHELQRWMEQMRELALCSSGAESYLARALDGTGASGTRTPHGTERNKIRAPHGTGPTSKDGAIFGPFYYPFAFALGDKQRLQAAEAYERMRQRYLGAHDRQAELLQSQRMLSIDAQAEEAVRAGVEPGWPLLAARRGAAARACSPYLVLPVRRSRLVQDAVDLVQADAGQ